MHSLLNNIRTRKPLVHCITNYVTANDCANLLLAGGAVPVMADAPEVTERYYLCDACFLVGMESSDETLLNRLAEALSSPCFPLYLGRRACPPTLPLLLGIRSVPLADALREEPWQASTWVRRHAPTRLRMILENAPGEAPIHTLRDAPISFSPIHRRYTQRGLEREQMVELIENAHDPMAELY